MLKTRSVVFEREMLRARLVMPQLREPRSSVDLTAHLSARVGSCIDGIEPFLHIRFNANILFKQAVAKWPWWVVWALAGRFFARVRRLVGPALGVIGGL